MYCLFISFFKKCFFLNIRNSAFVSTAMGYWNELVMRCHLSEDATPEEGSVPVRPVRRLGSEFLGKRTMSMEQLCTELVVSEEIDEDWLCHCIRHWSHSPADQPPVEEESVVNKRGLGAILLSGKRMTNNKWNNGVNRRVMGSEFLGKRAIMGSEFLGKRALGSEFLGKRAIMGSEFLGKRSGRPNAIAKI